MHEHGEAFHYPTVRAGSSAAGVAVRYLECALTQVASLRLQDVPCDLALATNLEPGDLGRVRGELMSCIKAFGVEILPTEYRHRPSEGTEAFVSSRSTGPRNQAARVDDPTSIGLWHLPSEKGLSLRRAAYEILGGRTTRLRRDLTEPERAARRFNVAGTGLVRRVRDDGWIAKQRVRSAMLAVLHLH